MRRTPIEEKLLLFIRRHHKSTKVRAARRLFDLIAR